MKKRSSFAIFRSSIFALFLREMYESVGVKKIGYFWLFFDILFVVFIFAGLKSVVRDASVPGLDMVIFIAVNIMAFYFFKDTIMLLLNSFSTNKSLFDYRQVRPIDVLFSKFLFSLYTRILATLVMIAIGLYLNFDLSVKNFNMVAFSIIWLGIFALAIGLLSAVLASFFDFYKRFVKYLMLPLLFLSAVFYTVESLPPLFQTIILYNPVTHFMEMLHGSYFYALDTRYVDYVYMIYWTVIPLFLGLFFYTRSEKGIIAS
ncbi:MAG: ABC transporter permease [Sulfurimonas sp.]|nr:ABC transporter permease [Sulfurimonas sp.]